VTFEVTAGKVFGRRVLKFWPRDIHKSIRFIKYLPDFSRCRACAMLAAEPGAMARLANKSTGENSCLSYVAKP
jgi:hypothetical protein